jgi:hypothetical protein
MIAGIFRHDNQFFRFYPDGLFLDCLIQVRASEEKGLGERIDQWFRRDQEVRGVLRGQYSMTGKRIQFSTPGHFGDGKRLVEYSGTQRKVVLVLDSLDHNTGRRTKAVEFMRVAES